MGKHSRTSDLAQEESVPVVGHDTNLHESVARRASRIPGEARGKLCLMVDASPPCRKDMYLTAMAPYVGPQTVMLWLCGTRAYACILSRNQFLIPSSSMRTCLATWKGSATKTRKLYKKHSHLCRRTLLARHQEYRDFGSAHILSSPGVIWAYS